MSSILSWDDFDAPEKSAPVAPPPPVPVKPTIVPEVSRGFTPPVQALPYSNDVSEITKRALTRLHEMRLLGTKDNPFMGADRIRADDKRIIKGSSDVNQLIPFKYEWAWQKYLDGCANHWMPQEINMTADLGQWQSKDALSEDERLMVNRTLGFFSVADTMVANNLVMAIFNNITAPEARQYLLRQAFEEAVHAHSYQYCIQSLRMDEGETFNMYREVASIAKKMAWALHYTEKLCAITLDENSPDSLVQDFVEGLMVYYCAVEGIFFYCGFIQLLALGRSNKLSGVKEQIEYILRDESMHANFGIDVINQIKAENPSIWTPEFTARLNDRLIEAHCLEMEYIRDTLPRGVIGVNARLHEQYLMIIGNRRCQQIGIPEQFVIDFDHPYPWMSEMMDLRKEKNFAEECLYRKV